MLGTRALAKPGAKLMIDLPFVGSRICAPEVLAHQPHAGFEEVEGKPKRSGGVRRRSHAGIVTPPVTASACAHAARRGDLPPSV